MATSIIPKQASEPEFITQDIYMIGTCGDSFTITIQTQQGVNSAKFEPRNNLICMVLNVAKQGYKLVGIKSTPEISRYSSSNEGGIAPLPGTNNRGYAQLETDDDNNIIVKYSSSSDFYPSYGVTVRLGQGGRDNKRLTAVYVKI